MKTLFCRLAFLLIVSNEVFFSLRSFAQRPPFDQQYYKDGMYIFDDLLKVTESELFTTYKSEFGLGPNDEMRLAFRQVLDNGTFRSKYELYHNNTLVQGSMMNVLGDKGVVQRISGFWLKGLNVNVNSLISESQAITTAIASVGAQQYLWDDAAAEAELKTETGDPNATYYPSTAELMITKNRDIHLPHTNNNFALCYKVFVHATDPAGIKAVYVDAHTNQVFTSEDALTYDFTTTGTLWTWYNGYHSDIKTRSCTFCTQYWLQDIDGRNVYTNESEDYSIKLKDDNNQWNEDARKTAATAHWSIGKAWDFYKNEYGRPGTDFNGRKVHIRTKAPLGNYAQAAHGLAGTIDKIYLTTDGLYPGSSIPPSSTTGGYGYSMAMLDVLAHEYTHGMIRYTTQLGLLGDLEAGGLNEGYADIFGHRIESYVNNYTDWNVGEFGPAGKVRYFQNPHQDGPYNSSPAKYLEFGFWDVTDIHKSGGVLRKWYHLLTNGGTFNNYTVSGIGLNKTTDISYITSNFWLWPNATFVQAASQTLNEVKYEYGNCSNEHKQTARALRAVGFDDIPIPFCLKIIVDGPWVIDANSISNTPKTFKVRLNEVEGTEGTYTWSIPEGWNAVVNGNTLDLISVADYESKWLSATFTTSTGTTYTDVIPVHFSDEPWIPTTPSTARKSLLQDGIAVETEPTVRLFPNPAANSVRVMLPEGQPEAEVILLDLNGKVLRKEKISQQQNSIATADLSNGIYVLRVQLAGKTITRRLSIVH